MHIRLARFLPIAIIALAPVLIAQSPDAPKYLTPPPNIVAAFDAQPLPQSVLSPNEQVLALTYQHVAAGHRRAGAAGAATRGRARESEELWAAADSADLRDHAEADRRRQRDEGDRAGGRQPLERQVLAGRLAPVVSEHEGERDRAVDRRCGDRQREGDDRARIASTRRPAIRATG